MRRWRSNVFCVALAGLVVAGPGIAATDPQKVISVGGATTEIIYALGAEETLIARDSTSTYPPQALSLPNVGYARALSPEGVLSLDADTVIATEDAGPAETLEVLDAANVKLVMVPETYSVDGIVTKIELIGKALGREDAAAELIATVRKQIAAAAKSARSRAGQDPARVLFILSAANGRIMAAGADTGADGIITLSGAVNAMDNLVGYKPVTDEAIIAAAPDAILMMDRTGNHAVADDALFALPAIAGTPAGEHRRIIRMDGQRLLGFGPRTAEAVEELSRALNTGPSE